MLLETIKCDEGKVFNLAYHQARCDTSRKTLLKTSTSLDLSSVINPPPKGLYRCRVVYAVNIISIEYLPYIAKQVHTLKIVTSNLNYAFKYANRDSLNILSNQHSDYDDILIEKNGLITDTSIANIAFYAEGQWFTPKVPILKGTMREKLLHEKFLTEKDIRREDINQYTQVALMNAMIGFEILNDINIQGIS